MANVRTTVALPDRVLKEIDEAVSRGVASSRNEWLTKAAQRELRREREAEIDAAFRRMGEDEEYKREAEQVARDFEAIDREAWAALEAEAGPYPPG